MMEAESQCGDEGAYRTRATGEKGAAEETSSAHSQRASLPSPPADSHRARKGAGLGSWASLVAQTIKNSPAVRETWVRFMGWEDSLEEGMATHSSILAWRIP